MFNGAGGHCLCFCVFYSSACIITIQATWLVLWLIACSTRPNSKRMCTLVSSAPSNWGKFCAATREGVGKTKDNAMSDSISVYRTIKVSVYWWALFTLSAKFINNLVNGRRTLCTDTKVSATSSSLTSTAGDWRHAKRHSHSEKMQMMCSTVQEKCYWRRHLIGQFVQFVQFVIGHWAIRVTLA